MLNNAPHIRGPARYRLHNLCHLQGTNPDSMLQACVDSSAVVLCLHLVLTALLGPVLLVHLLQCTDLDGTLIEDGEEGDWVRQNDELTYLCAQHFAQYLAPAGGLIVFNTGRSIGAAPGAAGGPAA